MAQPQAAEFGAGWFEDASRESTGGERDSRLPSNRADSTVAIHQGACSCAISMISATCEFATPPHGDVR